MTDLQPAADIAWTVEVAGITLRRGGAAPVLLSHAEAAAWDLLARGASAARMVRLLAAIWGTDEACGASRLQTMLGLWRHRGWLERKSTCG